MAATIDLVIFFLAPLVALVGMMLGKFFHDFDEIKQKWPAYRCNPVYMPFAGLVQPEVSASMNFNQCMGLLSKQVLKVPMDSIQVYVDSFMETMRAIVGKLNIFRSLRAKLAGVIMTMVTMTMGKLTTLISTMSYGRDWIHWNADVIHDVSVTESILDSRGLYFERLYIRNDSNWYRSCYLYLCSSCPRAYASVTFCSVWRFFYLLM
jgi:hypothetical protein